MDDFETVLPQRAQVRIATEGVKFMRVTEFEPLADSHGDRHFMEIADD